MVSLEKLGKVTLCCFAINVSQDCFLPSKDRIGFFLDVGHYFAYLFNLLKIIVHHVHAQ